MRRILLPQLLSSTQTEIIEWIQHKMPPWAEGAVLGMSGGIDSSVVAGLTAKAFQGTGLKLYGYSLPTHINSEDDRTDAGIVAEMYGIPLEVVSIEKLMNVMCETLPGMSTRARGNASSRQRAVVLWTLAEMHKCIVMGTGNRDEDYGVGYCTLTGDGLVHLSPNGFLSKRLVREMGGELGLPERLVRREPTAGLEVGQTDFKDLGYTYEFLEFVIEGMDQGFAVLDIIRHPQIRAEWDRMRMPAPHTPHAFGSINEAVLDVLHRHTIALAKADLVRPKIPDIQLPRS